jgi:hypothetical protein
MATFPESIIGGSPVNICGTYFCILKRVRFFPALCYNYCSIEVNGKD